MRISWNPSRCRGSGTRLGMRHSLLWCYSCARRPCHNVHPYSSPPRWTAAYRFLMWGPAIRFYNFSKARQCGRRRRSDSYRIIAIMRSETFERSAGMVNLCFGILVGERLFEVGYIWQPTPTRITFRAEDVAGIRIKSAWWDGIQGRPDYAEFARVLERRGSDGNCRTRRFFIWRCDGRGHLSSAQTTRKLCRTTRIRLDCDCEGNRSFC